MATPIWRPERRNRKIGTATSEVGASNKMRIPESWLDRDGVARIYHSRIDPDRVSSFKVFGHEFVILYEAPLDDFTYGCTPEDVIEVASHVGIRDLMGLKVIAFRQPTRKQSLLNPVWGRLLYDADFGRYHGPAIVLEAVHKTRPMRWSNKMSAASRDELERLRNDGHDILSTSRKHIIRPTETSIRNTILYRTLLHEIGHWVHWLTDVVRPATVLSPSKQQAQNLYLAKSRQVREQFAHEYAEQQAVKLRAAQLIPFSPLGAS